MRRIALVVAAVAALSLLTTAALADHSRHVSSLPAAVLTSSPGNWGAGYGYYPVVHRGYYGWGVHQFYPGRSYYYYPGRSYYGCYPGYGGPYGYYPYGGVYGPYAWGHSPYPYRGGVGLRFYW